MNQSNVLEKWRMQRLEQARPIKCTLEITYRCNERCTHCYLEKFQDDKTRVLSLDHWKRVISEIKAGGVLYVDLIGGESMVHPNFWELVEEVNAQGMTPSIITNGLLLTEKNVQRLKENNVYNVTLSLYSLDPTIHDKMTSVKGSHKKILEAIERLLTFEVPLTLNCLLTSANIDSYFELEDWCNSKNIKISPDPFITPKMNNDPTPLKFRANEDQLRQYFETRAKRAGGISQPSDHVADDYVCGAGKLKCAVTPYGELLTCLDIRKPLGSLIEKSFEELWNNDTANYWRNIKNKDINGNMSQSKCATCDHCPGAALQELNTPFELTEYTKLISKIKNELIAKA